ncbi:hypothetical protein Q3G72_008451 [Acer saccharum]|nr:hypothetical protein Q3G72_008451 [Acer saccharum]
MCLVFVCDQEERVIARQQAPGACPYCGGMIQAMDVESQWRFCFVPFYFKTKRKFNCSVCAKRLKSLSSLKISSTVRGTASKNGEILYSAHSFRQRNTSNCK